MNLLKEAIKEVLNENMEEMEKAEYCFDALDKLHDEAENMQEVLGDINESKLQKCMKALDLGGDFDDIMERVKELKTSLDELIEDDLGAVLPGLERQIDEYEDDKDMDDAESGDLEKEEDKEEEKE